MPGYPLVTCSSDTRCTFAATATALVEFDTSPTVSVGENNSCSELVGIRRLSRPIPPPAKLS